MNTPPLDNYRQLMEEFLLAKISCKEFEEEFMKLFKSDETIRDEKIFGALDKLFALVDLFEHNPNIRGGSSMYIDEKKLLWSTRECLKKIFRSTAV